MRRRSIIALLLTAPALLASLGMQFQAPFYSMIFTGGNRVFFTNICEAVLFPYFVVFILALGTFVTSKLPTTEDDHVTGLDYSLIRFFCGACILMILGFVLGFLSLLRPEVTLPLFVVVLYIYFLSAPDSFSKFICWILTLDPPTAQALNNTPVLRILALCLRVSILVAVVFTVLVRGIVPEVVLTPDVMQVYSGYLTEVRFNHSIWLDPAHPVVLDFLVGRANGVHLFLSSFTSSYVNQLIGCMYFFSFAAITHRIVALIIPNKASSTLWRSARYLLPELAMLWVLSPSPFIDTQFGKYHLQTGAILLFLTWASLLFLFLNRDQGKWLYTALIPVIIAFPLSLPQYEVFIFIILVLAAIALILIRQKAFFKYFIYLLVLSSAVSVASLVFNQLYIGIPETNPYYVFIALSNSARLHLWTSPEQIMYLNMSYPEPMQMTLSTVTVDGLLHRFSELDESLVQALLTGLVVGPIVLFTWLIFRIKTYRPVLGKLIFIPIALSFITVIGFFVYVVVGSGASPLVRFQLLLCLGIFNLVVWTTIALLALPPKGLISQFKSYIKEQYAVADRRVYLFYLIFFIYFFGAWFLILIVNHPSFQGEFWYQAIYPVIALLVVTVFIIHWLEQNLSGGKPNKASSKNLRNFLKVLTRNEKIRPFNIEGTLTIIVVILLISVAQQYYGFAANYPINAETAVRYFVGQDQLEKTISVFESYFPWVNFQRCLDIGQAVPGDAMVLPLNALAPMAACNFSPLLPRNKIIQNFQSVLAPYYKTLLYGQPEESDPIYRQQGVNYFYVRKGDSEFWGPAFAHSFDASSLAKNFDIFWESDDAYILTWRGQGLRPVSAEVASYIEGLRSRSTTSNNNYENSGWLAFTRLRATLKLN